MILLVSNASDPTVREVSRHLSELEVETVLLDPGDLPHSAFCSFTISNADQGGAFWRTAGHTLGLANVKAAWYWHPRKPTLSGDHSRDVTDFCAREWTWFVQGLWRALPQIRWLNTPWHSNQAEHKLLQLQTARDVGLAIPPTLVSNDPSEIARFFTLLDGEVVHKLIRSKLFGNPAGKEFVIYTEPLTRSSLADLHGLALAPSIYQRNIKKVLDIRVTVVGGYAFSVAIHSQQSEQSRQDYRRYDLDNTPYEIHELPVATEKKCQELLKALGLGYGAVDLILNEDGDYIFLEVNPSGQFGWIEGLTGLPIARTLAETLSRMTVLYPEDTVPQLS